MEKVEPNRFSLTTFLIVVFLLSWPFQFIYIFLGESYRPILLVSMIMVSVGTFICGRYIFHDTFRNAGWSFGKLKHYLIVIGFAIFLWGVPSFIESVLKWHVLQDNIKWSSLLSGFAVSFLITLLPAFGEEFGWRGYLLPKLRERFNLKKALLIHAFITWAWHLPYLLVVATEMGNNLWVSITVVLLISIIPAMMHAVIFAFIWNRSGSLAVVTVYHSAFDEIRDSLSKGIGFGPLAEPWQMIVITITGIYLLLKGKWKETTSLKKSLTPKTLNPLPWKSNYTA